MESAGQACDSEEGKGDGSVRPVSNASAERVGGHSARARLRRVRSGREPGSSPVRRLVHRGKVSGFSSRSAGRSSGSLFCVYPILKVYEDSLHGSGNSAPASREADRWHRDRSANCNSPREPCPRPRFVGWATSGFDSILCLFLREKRR